MKKNMIQLFSRVAVLLWTIGFATAAHAQATLGMENNLAFHLGENQVAISMNNSVEIANVTMKLYLPTGMELVGVARGEERTTARTHAASYGNRNADGSYTVAVLSGSNRAFTGTSGTILTLTIKATGTAAATSTISVKDIELVSPDETAYHPDDLTAAVTIAKELDGTAVFGVETDSYEVVPEGTFKVNVTLENTATIPSMQGVLTLPEGLELVEGEEGLFDYTDRIPMNASFSFDPATVGAQQYKFMLSSMSNTPFVKGSSTFFSFTLKATEALAETSIIRLNQFVVSDPYATAFKLDDDITISVTNLAIGNENVYEALAAEIAALQQQLDDAKAQVAEDDADVAEDFEDDAAAIQEKIDALTADLEAQKEAVALNAESTLDADKVQEVKDAIQQLIDDAAAAQQAYEEQKEQEAQEAKEAANQAAYEALSEEIAALQQQLDDAKAQVAEDDADVAEDFEDDAAAIQEKIDALTADLEAQKEAVALNAESTLDADKVQEVKDAIQQLIDDAAAAQQAYEEQKEQEAQEAKEAANQAAYEALSEEIAALQQQLDDAKAQVAEDDADVAEDFEEDAAAIQEKIDALTADLEAKKEAVALNAESTLDADKVQEVKDAIQQMLDDAAAAQQAYEEQKRQEEEDAAKQAANEAAYQKLLAQLTELQKKLDNAKKQLAEEYADVADDFEEEVNAIQQEIASMRTDLRAKHNRGELTANSTVNTRSVEREIEQLLADAAEAHGAIMTTIDGVKPLNDAEGYYTLSGVRLSGAKKGAVNLIRTKDGRVKKVLVK